jgi:hypothetical protein
MERVRKLTPSRPTLICVVLCALIVAAAAVDLLHTESRLPDADPPCTADTSACRNAEHSEELARLRAAEPLQDQYDSRAWLYASAVLAIVAVTVAYELRSTPRTDWQRIFTNLGVIGVWLGIAGTLLLIATDGNSLTPPSGPVLLLPVAMLVAAATGTLVGRSEGWSEPNQAEGVRESVMRLGKLAIHVGSGGQVKRSRLERLARWLVTAALVLAGLTAVIALVSVLAGPECSANDGTSAWTDPIDALAALAAIGGIAAAIGALLLRRWVAALTALVVCPLAVLVVLASTCAFY